MTRQRRDAGTIKVGPRDLVGMSWCAVHGAVRMDQLAQVFAQLEGHSVSTDAARKTIERWLGRGWATSATLLVRERPFVWLTPAGMRHTGLDLPTEVPSINLLEHNAEVVDIRLFIEASHDPASGPLRWRAERLMRAVVPPRVRGERSPHLPDGELWLPNGSIVAIERERTAKTIARTQAIMLGLCSRRFDFDHTGEGVVPSLPPRYASVWYYASDEALGVVTKASILLPPDFQPRVQIVRWP
jgi:hypothetical protein